jgi:hypothetical protein
MLLLKRLTATPTTSHGMRCYASLPKRVTLPTKATLPKKAAGRFTSNKLINQPIEGQLKDVQQTLVYLGKSTLFIVSDDSINLFIFKGPFAETMRRYKMTASFFGLCGIFAVPALLSTGQAPVMSVALGKKRLKKLQDLGTNRWY